MNSHNNIIIIISDDFCLYDYLIETEQRNNNILMKVNCMTNN